MLKACIETLQPALGNVTGVRLFEADLGMSASWRLWNSDARSSTACESDGAASQVFADAEAEGRRREGRRMRASLGPEAWSRKAETSAKQKRAFRFSEASAAAARSR